MVDKTSGIVHYKGMRILEAGNTQKGWSKRLRCTGEGNCNGGCGALLLVEQADIFMTASHHYDGSSDYYQTFKCSSCGVLTDFSDPLPFKPPTQKDWEQNPYA